MSHKSKELQRKEDQRPGSYPKPGPTRPGYGRVGPSVAEKQKADQGRSVGRSKKRSSPRKEGIIESVRKLIVVPIKRNIKRGYLDIFKHPLGSKDPRVLKKKTNRETTKRKTSRQSSRGGGR